MSKGNKRSFAIIAIIVGSAGVGIGAYSIATVGINLNQQYSAESTKDTLTDQKLHSLTLSGSPVLGSINAPITIIEYGDYQCPNCQRFNTQVKPLILENYIKTGGAKLVFKDFPIYGNDSVNGAVATHCAAEQAKYWEMHDHLYEHQKAVNSGWLSLDNIENFALQVGLEAQQFKACLVDGKYDYQVNENFEQGKSIGVKGTPTFIIIDKDGRMETIPGAQPYSVFEQVLDEMLVNKGK
ncbi:MAG: DsbA family protein [Nitrososphaerales archaeon]